MPVQVQDLDGTWREAPVVAVQGVVGRAEERLRLGRGRVRLALASALARFDERSLGR